MADLSRLMDVLANVPDPRVERTRRHDLVDILVIALLAVVCGGESFVDMENFGKAKQQWLKEHLGLIHGIPSHDTFARVLSRIAPDALSRCLQSLLSTMKENARAKDSSDTNITEVIAIDGKSLRRSYDTAKGQAPLHLVSAWANEARLVLGQVAVDQKSNEITAIPALLDLVDVKGCAVTLDAMGCQKAIAKKIVDKGGDYVLALKANQGLFHEDVHLYLTDAHQEGFSGTPHTFHETTDYGHGRTETRRCFVVTQIDWLKERHPEWENLSSMVLIESVRTEGHKTSTEHRLYVSSLVTDAKALLSVVRAHWGIENSLHWVLDVVFGEDLCRVRKDHAARNFAILRHLALNLVRSDTSSKSSLRVRRKRAGWDNNYLQYLLKK